MGLILSSCKGAGNAKSSSSIAGSEVTSSLKSVGAPAKAASPSGCAIGAIPATSTMTTSDAKLLLVTCSSGTNNLVYSWKKDNVTLDNKQLSLAIKNLPPGNYNYSVTVSNSSGASQELSYKVSVGVAASIPNTVIGGVDATDPNPAMGGVAATVGVPLTGGTSGPIVIPSFSKDQIHSMLIKERLYSLTGSSMPNYECKRTTGGDISTKLSWPNCQFKGNTLSILYWKLNHLKIQDSDLPSFPANVIGDSSFAKNLPLGKNMLTFIDSSNKENYAGDITVMNGDLKAPLFLGGGDSTLYSTSDGYPNFYDSTTDSLAGCPNGKFLNPTSMKISFGGDVVALAGLYGAPIYNIYFLINGKRVDSVNPGYRGIHVATVSPQQAFQKLVIQAVITTPDKVAHYSNSVIFDCPMLKKLNIVPYNK